MPQTLTRPTEEETEFYLREGYVTRSRAARSLRLYYATKPLLPRRVQLAARRAYARRLRGAVERGETFPRWPVEPLLVERDRERLRAAVRARGGEPFPILNTWPGTKRFALILTHDVEGPAGIANIPAVLEVERRWGMVSSWNFVAEDYPIPDGLFDELRAAGCEVGLHGIKHDGRMFESRESFDRHLPLVRRYLADWGAVGFRSPATYRNPAWMPSLGCDYDTSFTDTDPFEPQPGGCCSILPYFLDDMVELPITMTQDHTVFEILREPTNRLWEEKAGWLIRHGGLVNVLFHPDYVIDERRLARYDELLGFLAGQANGWHALPREVAAWWRVRSTAEVGAVLEDDDPRLTVVHVREADGELVVDFDAGGCG